MRGSLHGWKFPCLPRKEINLIDAVDLAVIRYSRARNTSKCGVYVDNMNDLVRDTTRRNLSRPANNEGGAERRLHRREVGSAPWAGVSLPWIGTFRSVIAAEDDNRVVLDTGVVDGVEDLASAIVHLSEHVLPSPRYRSCQRSPGPEVPAYGPRKKRRKHRTAYGRRRFAL